MIYADTPYDLTGKVALVTGAAGGMGTAISARLLAAGARVVMADRPGVDCLQDGASRFIALDVTEESDWQSAIADITAREDRLDILVNNAGVLRKAAITQTSAEMFAEVIAVNQIGTFLGMKHAAPLMAQQGGSIINLCSTAGLKAAVGHVAYCASKFAVHGMTKVAALEFAPLGIRVNSVHPGLIDTPMVKPFYPEGIAQFAPRQLLDRPGQPTDVAEVVGMLASDAAAFSTGSEFICDGGYITGSR